MEDVKHPMDWAKAIETHQIALSRIVASMIAMLGLASEGVAARLPRPLYRAILRVLRPAESAVRRLIAAMAQGLQVKLSPARPPRPTPAKGQTRSGTGSRCPSFPLFDPPERVGRSRPRRKAVVGAEPRIHFFDGDSLVSSSPPKPAKLEDGCESAMRLSRRLAAIKGALDNLPGQAKRLARWRARLAKRQPPIVKSPLRPGPPPGIRQKPQQEIDWLLWECHLLAMDRLTPDTS